MRLVIPSSKTHSILDRLRDWVKSLNVAFMTPIRLDRLRVWETPKLGLLSLEC